MSSEVSLRTGTTSGTLLGIMPTILSEDILRTVVLAFIGALVSFCVTLALKWLLSRRK